MEASIIIQQSSQKDCNDEEDDEEEEERILRVMLECNHLHLKYMSLSRQYSRQPQSFSKPESRTKVASTFKSTHFVTLVHLLIIALILVTGVICSDQINQTSMLQYNSRSQHHPHRHKTSKLEDALVKSSNAFVALNDSRFTKASTSNITHRSSGRRVVRSLNARANSSSIANTKASMKVSALATRLEQWLKCYRMNLMSTQQRSVQNSLSPSKVTEGQTESGTEQLSSAGPEQSICPAHYDGHLCWPEARAGQEIRLDCPKIDFLSAPQLGEASFRSSANPLVTGQTNQPLKSVIKTIQRQQDSLNAGDINQTQEITSANIQSITPTGSRGGIATANINQSGQMTDRPPYNNAPRATIDSSSLNNNEKANPGQEQRRKARRTCEGPSAGQENDTTHLPGQWQQVANYDDCKLAGNLFDPIDELVAPNDQEIFTNLREQLERIEPSIDPYSEPDLLEQWILCIGSVLSRLDSANAPTGRDNDATRNGSSGYCPIIFDGWRCWPATEAGEIAYVNCPKNQPGFSAERKAYKICTRQADWYRHPETNRYWSNYTTCVDTVDLAFRTKILNLYVIGNLISLIALTVSLIIFVSFKSLNCTRVTIHKNLFLSFITNNLMWIIWYTYVVNDADLLQSNPIGCRLWHILLHYFLVSNYFWMFCEGLYLHTLLVVAFVSEGRILKWFYLLGWLSPVPIILTYAYNRSYDEYYTNFCWMEESPHNVILMAPIGFSLLLNLIFLINIVRVLVTKLRANNSPDAHQTRKAVRATLILIPLLGLHYMLTPFRPEAKSEWEVYYEIIAAVCTSFQGLCVALLFCFCNGEVLQAIKKRLKDSILFNRDNKRTMRSRSNTAISNVSNNHHQNNGHQPNQRRPFEAQRSLVSSSSSYGNLITNQLQREPLMANHNSKPNGQSAMDLSSQRTSVMTTVTEVSPLRGKCAPNEATIETKLIFDGTTRTSELIADETIKLLARMSETNNNNTNSMSPGAESASC